MARTFRNLWPQVVAWDNLLLAYRKCRRRKRYKASAVAFEFTWEQNLLELQSDLTAGRYLPGTYRHFHITEPKPRKISAAPFRDRVVHHALVNVLEPIYDRRFIFDSYACRRGKGTHRALSRAQMYLRRHQYYLKTDIVRFFPNVDHAVMLKTLQNRIRDQRLLDLIQRIISSGKGILDTEATRDYFPGDDLFAVLRPTGLPIGNLTSQFFANVLLDQIDHFVKEQLRVPGYVRYSDDLVLFADSKPLLWEMRDQLADKLADLRLRLHWDKTQLFLCRRGLKFLGFKVFQTGRRLQQSTIRRFNRRVRRQQWLLKRRRIQMPAISHSLRCWLSHVRQANAEGIRRDLWRRLRF